MLFCFLVFVESVFCGDKLLVNVIKGKKSKEGKESWLSKG